MRACALACAVWAGAAAGQDLGASSATYVCAGGAVVRVAYLNVDRGPSLAVIDWAGDLVAMRTTPTASGAHYVAIDAARSLRWRTKGAEGVLAGDGPDGSARVLLADCVAAAR